MLIGHPQLFWIHKGFVIKPGGHQATEGPYNAHYIKIDTGPAINARSFKVLIELYLSSFKIGNSTGPRAELNNTIGFLGAMAKDASGACIFKTAADHIDAIGQ